MVTDKKYIGINHDTFGGITPTGTIIRDAWVFGILPESETCAGWRVGQIQEIYDKVAAAWTPYGNLASRLPPDLAQRHQRIYDQAITRAREQGWEPDMESE